MKIDIERRKIRHETKLKMKEYEEQKTLRHLFTPSINKRSKSASRLSEPSVFKRLGEDDIDRRKSSFA